MLELLIWIPKNETNIRFETVGFNFKIENLTWDLIFAYSWQFSAISKCWKNLKKLKHWNIEINSETLKTLIDSMLKFWITLTSNWVSMFIFLTSKTLNRNQCQCWCRPLVGIIFRNFIQMTLFLYFLNFSSSKF